jgi:hypothetical protein
MFASWPNDLRPQGDVGRYLLWEVERDIQAGALARQVRHENAASEIAIRPRPRK